MPNACCYRISMMVCSDLGNVKEGGNAVLEVVEVRKKPLRQSLILQIQRDHGADVPKRI